MKIFLTGASGFIGKIFCNIALKRGHYIYAPTRKKNLKKKKLKWLHGDFSDDWKKELKHSDVLIHFASSGVNKSDTEEIFDVNLFKSIKLLNNAIKYNCKKWFIISTSSEYGFRAKKGYHEFSTNTNRLPDNEYGLSKAIFTDVCINLSKKYNCITNILRLFPIYGKGENKHRLYPSIIRSIKKNKSFYIKNPHEIRDFTNVKYASKKILDLVEKKDLKKKHYRIWHISEKNSQSIKKFTKKIWKIYKGKKKLQHAKSKYKYNHISDRKSLW